MSEWSCIKNSWSDCSIWLNKKRVAVLSIYDEATEESQDELEAEMDERAARITACLNALEGLSDIALLGGWSYKGMNAHALKIEQENAALQARVAELEAICDNVPEGCTPADARVLREANHRLAAEVANLDKRVAIRGELCRATLKSKAEIEKERDKWQEIANRWIAVSNDQTLVCSHLREERDGLAAKCAHLESLSADELIRPTVLSGCLAKLKADAVRDACKFAAERALVEGWHTIDSSDLLEYANQIEREGGRE